MPRLRERIRNLFKLLRAARAGMWVLGAVGVGLLIGGIIFAVAVLNG